MNDEADGGGPAAEVIVVGAGPAGAVAAMCLARAGRDVLLVDRGAFPRPKPCGDCLSPGATPILDRLGLLPAVEALRPARLAGWRLVSPAGHAWAARFDGRDPGNAIGSGTGPAGAPVGQARPAGPSAPVGTVPPVVPARAGSRPPAALAVDRRRFDAVLLDAAIGAGARVATGTRIVAVDADAGVDRVELDAVGAGGERIRLRARVAVGADGLRSVVARRSGLHRRAGRPRKVSLTAHVPAEPTDEAWGELHFGDGWVVGIAPVAATNGNDGVVPANVTLVADLARWGAELRRDAAMFFRRRVFSVPSLRRRLPCENGWPGRLLASGPFHSPVKAIVRGRVALVGDAAGYYDPLTGQGIFHAIAGAELLAAELEAVLRGNDPAGRGLRGYARRHRRLVGGARRVQRLLEIVIGRPRLADFAFDRLAHAPAAAQALIGVIGDLRPPRALLASGSASSFLRAVVSFPWRSDVHRR